MDTEPKDSTISTRFRGRILDIESSVPISFVGWTPHQRQSRSAREPRPHLIRLFAQLPATAYNAPMESSPVVLVTGASRGLGRGIAQACAHAGYHVAIHYASNEAAAAETVSLQEGAVIEVLPPFAGG